MKIGKIKNIPAPGWNYLKKTSMINFSGPKKKKKNTEIYVGVIPHNFSDKRKRLKNVIQILNLIFKLGTVLSRQI